MALLTEKFDKALKTINKFVLKYLVFLLTICIFLGAIHLTIIIIQHLIEPPYALLEVSTLLEIFNLVLIIVVGYELIKTISVLAASDTIPIVPIIQIAMTGVSTKIITFDFKHTEAPFIYGIAALMLSLSASLFFATYRKES